MSFREGWLHSTSMDDSVASCASGRGFRGLGVQGLGGLGLGQGAFRIEGFALKGLYLII